MVRLSLLLFVFVCGCCLKCVPCAWCIVDVVGVCCCVFVLCLSVFVRFVCGLSCGILCFVVFCVSLMGLCSVFVLWCVMVSGVCVCAFVRVHVLFVRFVLLCSNMFVCFVWDVLCDDVWFVVCVCVCVIRLMCLRVVSVEYCVMLYGVTFLFYVLVVCLCVFLACVRGCCL